MFAVTVKLRLYPKGVKNYNLTLFRKPWLQVVKLNSHCCSCYEVWLPLRRLHPVRQQARETGHGGPFYQHHQDHPQVRLRLIKYVFDIQTVI